MTTDDTTNNPRLQAALEFARQGYRVHPLRPKSKKPLLSSWTDRATTDEDQIRRWWEDHPGANPGLYLTPERTTLVVDVDTKNGGDRVFAFLRRYLPFPPTMTTRTPSGGLHLYYTYPRGRVVAKDHIGFAPGIDVLMKRNVVIPPAETLDGVYRWEEGPRAAATAPGWLVDILEDPEGRAGLPTPVHQGGRNDALNEFGFRLRHHHRLRDETVKAAMLLAGLNSCTPVYPGNDAEVAELEGTIRSVLESQGAEEPAQREETLHDVLMFSNLTDLGNLRRLKKLANDTLRYWDDGRNHSWFRWNETYWEETDASIIQMYAHMIAHELVSRAEAVLQEARLRGEEDPAAQALREWGRALENDAMVQRLIRTAEKDLDLRVAITDFDDNDWLAGTPTVTLNLAAGRIGWKEPDPSLMISKRLGTSYDPDATCPAWDAFVHDVMSGDEEMVRYLQRAVGYSLTGSTQEQVMFLLVGSGANGKSVFLRVVNALAGDYGRVTGFETFDIDTKRSIPNDLAALRGARFVYATEREDERRMAEGRVKSVTGGDELEARRLYGEFFTFQPKFKVWLALNQLPVITGDDDGIWRRLQVVDFRESYIGREDKTLADRLLRELPGILNWALAGLADWHDQGLAPPARVIANTAQYRSDMDVMGLFVAECLQHTDNDQDLLDSNALYRRYQEWCASNGHHAYSKTKLTRRLKERFGDHRTTRYRGRTHWIGMQLTSLDDLLAVDDPTVDYEIGHL